MAIRHTPDCLSTASFAQWKNDILPYTDHMIIHCVNKPNIHWRGFAGSLVVPALPHHLLSDCPEGGRTIQNNPFIHCLFHFFCLIAFATDVLVQLYFTLMIILPNITALPFPLLLQPSVKLCLPSNPGGFARAPTADWPPTGHRGLRLRPQPASHPPVAGLRHPEARPRHPPHRAERQRALGHLQ